MNRIALRLTTGAAATAITVFCVAASVVAQTPFHLEEATISTIRAAFASGQLTCTQLTKLYLNRIEAYT